LRRGAPLAPRGLRLMAGHLGALAAAGVRGVRVHRAPRIAVLVTGDEVVARGAADRLGEVPDANGPLVTAWLAARGCPGARLEYVPDSAAATRRALARALERSDLVVTTGGVSVGDHDHIPSAAESLGARRLFWKVAQKPGKPLYAARGGRALLLGLPGNPAAVLVNLVVYVRRALDVLEGLATPGPVARIGVLEAGVEAEAGRDRWLRMGLRYDERGGPQLARLPRQGSHMLSNLVGAQALAWIPAGCTLPAGSVVRWFEL
jgi:molybdopterin molybdotransferase